jgi:hypothetical protein
VGIWYVKVLHLPRYYLENMGKTKIAVVETAVMTGRGMVKRNNLVQRSFFYLRLGGFMNDNRLLIRA